MESCIYEGTVRHERITPVRHAFAYRLFLAYLDLAEIPELVRTGLISVQRFGLASFCRRDYFGDQVSPLDECVRERVLIATGSRPSGPIRMLTQLSCLGYNFTPLSLFFCLDETGRKVEYVLAEVRNTPWLERHVYVLWHGNGDFGAGEHRFRHRKGFHVSPFMPMNIEYRWRLSDPGERLGVELESLADDRLLFRASLQLRRTALTRQNRNRMLARYPLQPARVTASIYWQAFQLWRKKCPFHAHPSNSIPASPAARLPTNRALPSCSVSFETASTATSEN